MEEARKFVVKEKEGNTTALSGEVIMESFRSPEEEVELNNPVPYSHIIPSYNLSSFFSLHVSNPSHVDTKEKVSGK